MPSRFVKRSAAMIAFCLLAPAVGAGCSGTGKGAVHQAWSYQGQRGITVLLRPADAGAYRALLPAAFGLPQEPRILVAIVSYDDVTSPLVPYREGYVMLACTYQGAAGWYTLTMPVTDRTANDAGRSIGFPKYVADAIELRQGTGGAWAGEVSHGGRSVLRLAFEPLVQGSQGTTTVTSGPRAFTLVPPGEGPDVYEVDLVPYRPLSVTSASGTAIVGSDGDEPWAAVLAGATVVSASFEVTTGDWALVPSRR